MPEGRPASQRAAAPTVSVVIPTRERSGRLAVTLAGALAQRDVDLEVVIVDNSTSPAERAAVDRLAEGDARVAVHRPPAPLAPAAARNAGIAQARGTYVAFLDDDDLWAPHKLAAQLAAMSEAGARWAWGGAWYVEDDGRVTWMAPGPSADRVAATLPSGSVIPAGASNVIARRDLLDEVGGFDEAILHMPDWDLWLRLAERDPGAACTEALVAYVQHSTMYSTRDTSAFESDLARIDAKLRDRGVAPDDAAVRRGLLEWMATGHLAAGQRRSAARAWLHSAIVARRPGDVARAAGALGGAAGLARVERVLERLHRRAPDQPAVPAAPAWLRDYPAFPVAP